MTALLVGIGIALFWCAVGWAACRAAGRYDSQSARIFGDDIPVDPADVPGTPPWPKDYAAPASTRREGDD